MRSPAERSNLRRRIDLAYREYRAIYILGNGFSGPQRERADKLLKAIPSLPRKVLQAKLPEIRSELQSLKRWIGAKGSLPLYEEILRSSTKTSTVLWVPKWFIQEYLFDHYEKGFPLFSDLAPHARVAVDVHGIIKPAQQEIGWNLLEGRLFEDMAWLWNMTMEAEEARQKLDTKHTTKKRDALMRSTVRSAYHLIEGYLNSLAWDIVHVLKNDLTQEERVQLTEWDEEKRRKALLGLREKMLQYPKIATRSKHPPLQENSCPEMRLILEKEDLWRHALVHPKIESGEEAKLRESVFFDLSFDDVKEIVDASVRLIRQVGRVVGETYGKLDLWLFERGADGRFSDEAFE
jgi:hypothetical protein